MWAARFFKTRALAKAAIDGGKVTLDGKRIKPAKELSIGQTLTVRRGDAEQTLLIRGLSDKRGPATIAATLYAETQASIELRERYRAEQKMQRAGLQVPKLKPNKKGRRDLRRLKALPGE